jgi:CBS domain-containing protein
MADTSAQQPVQPPQAPATVADIMKPPLSTVEPNDHVAAAAYLMKHADTSALVILDPRTGVPAGIITSTDIANAVADGRDLNETRIHDLMTARPVVIDEATSISDAARTMTGGRFRHLPVVGDAGLIGMVDITDVCGALLGQDLAAQPAGGAAPPQ